MNNISEIIAQGKTAIGMEFGSTRIKAVLIDSAANPLASGSFDWENSYKNGIWTYSLSEVKEGMQTAFANLKADTEKKYGVKLTTAGALGISGMMHGYLAFDKDGNQLAEFRTWRNTITAEAAEKLLDTAEGLLTDDARRAGLETNIRKLGRKDASEVIAREVLKLIR